VPVSAKVSWQLLQLMNPLSPEEMLGH